MLKNWTATTCTDLKLTFVPNKNDDLSGTLYVENSRSDSILLKIHRTLGLMLGFFSFDQLVNCEKSNQYEILKVSPTQPEKPLTFRVDITAPYKIISLYSSMLFSVKNQILEISLSKGDFHFLSSSKYEVNPSFYLPLSTKQFQIERGRNLSFCDFYFLDIFGEKIEFKSGSIFGQTSFSI